MTDYTQYKVNELKDLLRKRNLSLSGTKSELIRRLEEDDASQNETVEPAQPEEEPAQETTEEKQPQEVEEEKPAVAETKTSEAPSSEATASTTVTISDDELLAKVKADLEQQIKRAKRFGVDTTELEAREKRILKFGISAVRDAAEKANSKLERSRKPGRRHKKKFHKGPKPATA